MTPRAAALANALAGATGQDWRWMECEDGTQYAARCLPCGATVVVTAPPHASLGEVLAQVCHAVLPLRDRGEAE